MNVVLRFLLPTPEVNPDLSPTGKCTLWLPMHSKVLRIDNKEHVGVDVWVMCSQDSAKAFNEGQSEPHIYYVVNTGVETAFSHKEYVTTVFTRGWEDSVLVWHIFKKHDNT